MNKVQKNQLNRFKILEATYNAQSDNKIIEINSKDFLENNHMSEEEKDEAILYLVEKGLCEDFGCSNFSIAKINAYGIDEYERLMNKPQEDGLYLPAMINYINVESMTDSQIQQGNIESSQIMTINNNDIDKIQQLFKQILEIYNEEIKDNLTDTARNIINEDFDFLEKEISKPTKIYRNLKEGFRVLLRNFQLIGNTYIIIESKIIPLAMQIYNYFNQ